MHRPALEARAELLSRLRQFFEQRKVLEVDVPLLGVTAVTDPHIASAEVNIGTQTRYLQTSPEFFMKRLLAAGSGSIYYLGKAVRNDPITSKHNPEFTMLEWYREGMDDRGLMNEVGALFQFLASDIVLDRVSYRELFEQHFGFNPHSISNADLAAEAKKHVDVNWATEPSSTWFDLLFSHVIEPTLKSPTIVYDYPACMCALARVEDDSNGDRVARRFEVFWKGVELANAYWELSDAGIQRARFEQDIQQREALGLIQPNIDENLLSALDQGLPDCAGIALGVDRLLMCLLDVKSIEQVMAFPDSAL